MPYSVLLGARPVAAGQLNRCLASLPAKDFSLLAPHLRTVRYTAAWRWEATMHAAPPGICTTARADVERPSD